jgi:hypothetical protein
MSLQDAVASSVTSTVVPMAAAAFATTPLPPETGIAGMIWDERARAENATDWMRVGPPLLGLACFVGGVWLGYSAVRRRAARSVQT